MVSIGSGGKQSSSSNPMTNLPWRETRGLMGRAEKRFVEPLLTGDLAAPAFVTAGNIARGESTKAMGEMLGQLAGSQELSTPMKAKLANDAMSKITEMASGARVKTYNDLVNWFDKVTGSMGQMSSQKSGGGFQIGLLSNSGISLGGSGKSGG